METELEDFELNPEGDLNENGEIQGNGGEYLTYDDVQIRPQFSEVESRSNCDISSRLSRNVEMEAPFIASPMDTVCEEDMAFKMWELGGVGIIHRFDPIDTQVERVHSVRNRMTSYLEKRGLDFHDKPNNLSAAIGATGDYLKRANRLINAGVKVLLIDVAHGHHKYLRKALSELNNQYPDVDYIAGSIATPEAALDLIEWGADALRVGVGNGCFTPNMEVDTDRGRIPISEVEIGDAVQTHTGKWKNVVDTFEYEENDEVVVVNDEIECTKDHEFYVVHERYADVVDEDNIDQYAEWVEARNLTDEYYMVEYDMGLKLTKVESVERKEYDGKVHDLKVEDDHSYNIGGIIVHNSMCETRIRTGIGVPQVSALHEISKVVEKNDKDLPIVADGGIKNPGDLAKAVAVGASSGMLGSVLSGTKETPGAIQRKGRWPNEELYKQYRGSASFSSKKDRGEDTTNIEGNSRVVKYKGKTHRIFRGLKEGLQSSMSYVGAKTIDEFQENAHLLKVTNAGHMEGTPHGMNG